MNRILVCLSVLLITSCVSKKKLLGLEERYKDVKERLKNERLKKGVLEVKFALIQRRIDNYNKKINALRSFNSSLEEENYIKLDMIGNVTVISNLMKNKMRETLKQVNSLELKDAKTLKDSLNVAVAYNLKKSVNKSIFDESDDINIDIDQTVVMISISDRLLFKTGSHRVSRKSYKLLKKLSNVIKSEPSMDVMIEGHADTRPIHNKTFIDNWDLSVKRATSIVRILENKFGIAPNRLIASGRGNTIPLTSNDSKEGRARNRRTKIIILPNIDKFFSFLEEEGILLPKKVKKHRRYKKSYNRNGYLRSLRNLRPKSKLPGKCIINEEEHCEEDENQLER